MIAPVAAQRNQRAKPESETGTEEVNQASARVISPKDAGRA